MKKTILIQTILVVLSLLLLIYLRVNQPPFEYIPTTIELSGANDAPRRAAAPEPTPRVAPSQEERDAEPDTTPAPVDTPDDETNYR